MLNKAREGKYAVGQFNINNLEWTKAILLTAEELKSPVILGVSEGAGKYMTGFKTVSAMVKAAFLYLPAPIIYHFSLFEKPVPYFKISLTIFSMSSGLHWRLWRMAASRISFTAMGCGTPDSCSILSISSNSSSGSFSSE